jgi:hypothetical protein
MIAVIFEFTPDAGRFDDYRRLAIERFESISSPGRFVSLSFWHDEQSRVAHVVRDYGMQERDGAPEDSVKAHG